MAWSCIAIIKNDRTGEYKFTVFPVGNYSGPVDNTGTTIRYGGYRESGSESGSSDKFKEALGIIANIESQGTDRVGKFSPSETDYNTFNRYIYGKSGVTAMRINVTVDNSPERSFTATVHKYISLNNGVQVGRISSSFAANSPKVEKNFVAFGLLINDEEKKIWACVIKCSQSWYTQLGVPAYYDNADVTIYVFDNYDTNNFWEIFSDSIPPEYPWKEEGTGTGGGEGKWDDDSSDIINPPSVNLLNSNQLTDTFFATTYRLTKEELRSLGRILWTPTVLDSLKTLFGNPLESIINLYLLPFDSYKGEKVNVTLGKYDTGVTGYLTNQFVEINCGVLEIPEKWGAAIDFQSRVQIYLPFIGTKEIDTAEVMGSQIGVKYLIDVLTGSCVAFISVKKGNLESVLYQFTGNCASSFPLTQASYNTFYSALLSSTAAFASGVVTGTVSAPMAISAGSSIAMSAKTHIAHSGNLTGNAGYMGIKKPYLIITRPIQALPADFGKYKGYQSHITKKLSECKGYTEVEYIHLDGINRATSAELAQIESLLKGGVIIS